MKATIEFNLPEDREEYDQCNNAANYFCALVELDEWLRTQIKHQGKDEFQPCRDQLRFIIQKYNIEV